MKRIAFYGGSFDPPHKGHFAIADALIEQFDLDEFIFLPAFHAPHKVRLKPTSAYDRYAMLCLATNDKDKTKVSRLEIELPEKPFTVETLGRLHDLFPNDRIFFVMGADSWMDIKTWREWEKVLTMADHIVVTRPGVKIGTDHVTDEIRKRILDLRGKHDASMLGSQSIFITDAVQLDISATKIREKIRVSDESWKNDVTDEVAKYIEKYQIYS